MCGRLNLPFLGTPQSHAALAGTEGWEKYIRSIGYGEMSSDIGHYARSGSTTNDISTVTHQE